MTHANDFVAAETFAAERRGLAQPSDIIAYGQKPCDRSRGFETESDRARQILGDVLRDAVLPRLIAKARDRL